MVFNRLDANHHRIDYSLAAVDAKGEGTEIRLERKELMPMPLEILVQLKDGGVELHYIYFLMRGEKENPYLWNDTAS